MRLLSYPRRAGAWYLKLLRGILTPSLLQIKEGLNGAFPVYLALFNWCFVLSHSLRGRLINY